MVKLQKLRKHTVVLAGKLEGNRLHGRPRYRWK